MPPMPMKHKTVLLLSCILFSMLLNAQENRAFKLNQKYCTNVVKSIFNAAKSRSFDDLNRLCDPSGFGDRDVKRICSITQLANTIRATDTSDNAKKNLEEFISIYESGKINGDVVYEKDGDTEYARVPIWYNHPLGEHRSNETMVLVKRTGKWYLYSF